jgi:hypothetical protein
MRRRSDQGVYSRRDGALSYGAEWGVIMLDFDSAFVPGDMGNASTYEAPVLFRRVPGLSVDAILADADRMFESAVVDAAKALVADGASAITSNCGFMIRYQASVARALGGVPVGLSSLVQLPLIAATVGADKTIGIVTASDAVLDAEFIEASFPGLGDRVSIAGLQEAPQFRRTMFDGDRDLDADAISAETVAAVDGLMRSPRRPAAILLECAALPPYAAAIQRRWPGIPIFDFTTLTSFITASRQRTPFIGHY